MGKPEKKPLVYGVLGIVLVIVLVTALFLLSNSIRGVEKDPNWDTMSTQYFGLNYHTSFDYYGMYENYVVFFPEERSQMWELAIHTMGFETEDSFEDFINGTVVRFKANGNVVENQEEITIARHRGYKIDVDSPIHNTRSTLYGIYNNGTAVFLNFTTEKDEYYQYIDTVDRMFQSLKFIESDGHSQGNRPVFQDPLSYESILTPEQMRDDLWQLRRDLEDVHPKTVDGLPSYLLAAFEEADSLVSTPMTVGQFSIIVSELLVVLGDAHTSTTQAFSSDLRLPMEIVIIDDVFYILGGKEVIPGDKLVSMGGVGINDIHETGKKRIPAENSYWVNYMMRHYAILESTLRQIGAEIKPDKTMEVVVDRNGEIITISMDFNDKFTRSIPDFRGNEIYPPTYVNRGYGYYIDVESNYCYFLLTQCNYNDDYVRFLETMFNDIKANNIDNIIVDLRENTGGDSRVVNEFLRYVDIDQYKSFSGARRPSEASRQQRGHIASKIHVSEPQVLENEKVSKELLFTGDIFALIDNGTFSSANFFGLILADNDIGILIGEPSGNAPNSYGDILGFQLNNSRITYMISYTQWIRPKGLELEQDALYPDYQVVYTIDDYLKGRDLAMEKAMELIQSDE